MTDWSPTDPDAVNVYYDLSAWTPDQQAELAEKLADGEVPHGWEGNELVVPEEREIEVDAVIELLEAELNISAGGAPAMPVDGLVAGTAVTEYDLGAWNVADRQLLTESLIAARVPHRWESALLVVPTTVEGVVDELLDDIEGGDVVYASDTAGGIDDEAGYKLLDLFFVAGDRLARDPRDRRGLKALMEVTNRAQPSRPPAAVSLGLWRDLCALADMLADAIGGTDTPDEIHAISLAERLRDAVRPTI